jgi:DNA-binding response OmpR family regulator
MDHPKVLVVDDDPDVVALVRLELGRAGIHSDTADTAQAGLSLMQKNLYHVVLLDIHMPGMSGVEMLEALKRHNGLVQVIMLTSDACFERVIECMDRGASDFFSKTSSLHPIVEAVAGALSRAARWTSWMGTKNLRPAAAGTATHV